MAKKVEKRVPDIRFKGFTDDWEQHKFGSIFNKSNEKNDLSYGKDQVISVANMTWSSAPEKSTKKYMKTYNVAHFGDIVFEGHKNKMYQFGRFVENTIGDGIVSHIFDVYRPQDLTYHDLDFWKYYINSERVMRNTLRMSTTSARMMHNLVAKDLAKQLIKVPHFEESKRIGKILHDIDRTTDLQQKKLEQLKLLKKAMLQQLFPDKDGKLQSRFNGFTDAWEQRKFFDTVEKIIDFRGRTPKKLGMEWSAKGYPALSAVNVRDGYIDFSVDVHYANKELYDRWMSRNDLYKGQVVFTTEAPMGNVAQIPDNQKYILSQRTIAFKIDNTQLTDDFLAVLLRSPIIQHSLKLLASGGTAQGVSQKSLSQLKVFIPTKIKEQQLIGKYFHSLDTLITLHQRKLDHLKLLKKFLLQRIFI